MKDGNEQLNMVQVITVRAMAEFIGGEDKHTGGITGHFTFKFPPFFSFLLGYFIGYYKTFLVLFSRSLR
jgi:hypothetical protein